MENGVGVRKERGKLDMFKTQKFVVREPSMFIFVFIWVLTRGPMRRSTFTIS